MTLPWNENLKRENWAKLSAPERLAVLNDFEKDFAAQEGREPCQVGLLAEKNRQLDDDTGEPQLRGQHYSDEAGGHIELDPALLEGDRPPYQALETYFHEARHDYQQYAVEHPGYHDNPEQVEEWRKNFKGYIGEKEIENSDEQLNYGYYRWQPVEDDANLAARQRTDELYSGMFQDNQPGHYPDHQAKVDLEIQDDIDYGKNYVDPENYKEKARLASEEIYQDRLNAYAEANAATDTGKDVVQKPDLLQPDGEGSAQTGQPSVEENSVTPEPGKPGVDKAGPGTQQAQNPATEAKDVPQGETPAPANEESNDNDYYYSQSY